jgi:hypothetical protein
MVERKAERWMGFACKTCGTPLAVQRSDDASKSGQHSARGWRVTCTGLWDDRLLRARNLDGKDHGLKLKHYLFLSPVVRVYTSSASLS